MIAARYAKGETITELAAEYEVGVGPAPSRQAQACEGKMNRDPRRECRQLSSDLLRRWRTMNLDDVLARLVGVLF
jgi:hypothetical protein